MNAAHAAPVTSPMSTIRLDPGPAVGVRRIATAGLPSLVPETRASSPPL